MADAAAATTARGSRRGSSRARSISPHSRPSRIATLDKRSCEWRRLCQVHDALLNHLGGVASPVQLALISRCASLTVFIEACEKRAFQNNGELSERDAKTFLAFNNSLSRMLRQLGLRSVAPPPPSLADLFPGRDGA